MMTGKWIDPFFFSIFVEHTAIIIYVYRWSTMNEIRAFSTPLSLTHTQSQKKTVCKLKKKFGFFFFGLVAVIIVFFSIHSLYYRIFFCVQKKTFWFFFHGLVRLFVTVSFGLNFFSLFFFLFCFLIEHNVNVR